MWVKLGEPKTHHHVEAQCLDNVCVRQGRWQKSFPAAIPPSSWTALDARSTQMAGLVQKWTCDHSLACSQCDFSLRASCTQCSQRSYMAVVCGNPPASAFQPVPRHRPLDMERHCLVHQQQISPHSIQNLLDKMLSDHVKLQWSVLCGPWLTGAIPEVTPSRLENIWVVRNETVCPLELLILIFPLLWLSGVSTVWAELAFHCKFVIIRKILA